MNRRDFLACAGAAALGPLAPRLVAGAGVQRPNILMLLTDDQRWDALSCMGNPVLRTPNLDALAGDGVLFTRACVTTAICGASRASILTGRYARSHGVLGFGPLTNKLNQQTYPLLLKRAGYRVGFIGKYGVGNPPKAEYDYWRAFPGQGTYDHRDEDGSYLHLTKLMGRQAIEFLRGAPKDQPFCLSISFKAPHEPFKNDPAFDALYADAVVPAPETAAPKYWDALPEFFKPKNEGRRRWQRRFATPEMFQDTVKKYYRLITGVDAVVGRIRQELKRLGQADNTVILFMGDNGFFLGEHGLAGKWYGFEESIRVPLIVCDPRLPKRTRGRRCDEFALNIDIAPTIAALAGVQAPQGMQGRDLTPLLRGQPVQWRHEFLYEHFLPMRSFPIWRSEGVVGRRWKYLRYVDQDPPFEMLFDLQTDPHETTNLAGDPAHAAVLRQMRERHVALAKSIHPDFVVPATQAYRPGRRLRGVKWRGEPISFRADKYAKLPHTPALGPDDSYTWAVRVKVLPECAPGAVLMGNRITPGAANLHFMKITPDRGVQLFGGSRPHSLRLKLKVPRGRPAHVAVVKDGRRVTVFLDGKAVSTGAVGYPLVEMPCYLGGDPRSRPDRAACDLLEAQRFPRALSPDEVRRLAAPNP